MDNGIDFHPSRINWSYRILAPSISPLKKKMKKNFWQKAPGILRWKQGWDKFKLSMPESDNRENKTR
jgi:hypothetical protein